jgi:hypothetical protein
MAANAKKPKRQPVYLEARRLVDPATGEEIGALVPASPHDSRRLRALKLGQGHSLRAELSKPRNVKFHRLAHALGNLLVEHAPGFDGMGAHDAIKRLQMTVGACCDVQELDLGPLGKVPVKVPRSLAFDSMAEDEFGELFTAVCNWIDTNLAPSLTQEARADYFTMTGASNER